MHHAQLADIFSVPVRPLEMPQRTEEDEEHETRPNVSSDVSFLVVKLSCLYILSVFFFVLFREHFM